MTEVASRPLYNGNLCTGKNDAGVAPVGRQPQGPPNGCQHSLPNTAPVVHFTPSRSRYQFILLGERRHTCVNNLPRVAPAAEQPGIELATSHHEYDALPLHHQATQIDRCALNPVCTTKLARRAGSSSQLHRLNSTLLTFYYWFSSLVHNADK